MKKPLTRNAGRGGKTSRVAQPMPMTDHTAFLSAILADPDADGPRLVYADWLDESGDADRAEFIRVQCALARIPLDDRADDLQALELARREAELLGRNHEQWLQSVRAVLPGPPRGWGDWLLGPDPPVWEATFRRGFPELYAFDLDDYLRAAELLHPRAPVRALRLGLPAGPERDGAVGRLAACAPLAAVAELTLLGGWLNDAEVAELAGSPHVTGLRALGLGGLALDALAVAQLAASPLLARLRQLDLSDNPRIQIGAVDLFLAPAARDLEVLRLARTGFSAIALHDALLTPRFDRLAELDLSGNPLGNQLLDELLAWLPEGLTRLHLSDAAVSDAGARTLARDPRLGRLRWLDLSHNHLTIVGAAALAGSKHLAPAARLVLRGNRLEEAEVEALRTEFGAAVIL